MNISSISSVVDLCKALVQIPSENPSASSDSQGEEPIARFVAGFLEKIGAEVEYEEVAPGRFSVYGFWPKPAPDTQRILFAPHLDTVSVHGMTVDPFAAKIENGKIWGRGASDTKGTMAAMLWALKSVDWRKLNVAIGFAGLADEESGQLGAKAAAARHFADFVIAGEPTNLDVVYTHKGTAWIEVATTGKSAHASTPERGINAIDRMNTALLALAEQFPKICPAQNHPVLGPPTLSIGRIHGGTKINVVPDRCVAEVDIRVLPGQESIFTDIQTFFDQKQIPATIRTIKDSKPLFTDPEHPIINRLAGLGSKRVGASWFCDAALFANVGTPAIALGPGSIAQAHTADEFIEVAELERGAEFFTKFIRSLANG
jgi:acetylornithine deacetylase/succinyl-diaminopimelate desuccinylase-like protein